MARCHCLLASRRVPPVCGPPCRLLPAASRRWWSSPRSWRAAAAWASSQTACRWVQRVTGEGPGESAGSLPARTRLAGTCMRMHGLVRTTALHPPLHCLPACQPASPGRCARVPGQHSGNIRVWQISVRVAFLAPPVLKGGVHICKASEAQKLAEKMLGETLVTKQVRCTPGCQRGSRALRRGSHCALLSSSNLAHNCASCSLPGMLHAAPHPPPSHAAVRGQGQARQHALHRSEDEAQARDVLCHPARPLHRRPRHDWLQRGAVAALRCSAAARVILRWCCAAPPPALPCGWLAARCGRGASVASVASAGVAGTLRLLPPLAAASTSRRLH